jgi:hypothetical protein
VTKGKVDKTGEESRGRCRLCLQEAELLKSHVLSEFLYDPTYERYDPGQPKQGRMLQVPADLDKQIGYLQKGLRERLLCSACEQHLSRSCERYAAEVLKKMDETEIPAGQRSATADRTLVAGAGQRFESARRLSLFGLHKPNTRKERCPRRCIEASLHHLYITESVPLPWHAASGRGVQQAV